MSEVNKPKERNAFLDNLKGILIFLVVFGHFTLYYVDSNTADIYTRIITFYIYVFHMPLFIFISGYLSKNIEKAKDNAFNQILIPYLVFNTAMMLMLFVAGYTEFSLLTPIYSYWFLIALFFWRVLLKDLIRIRNILPISLILAMLIGFSSEFNNFLAIGRVVAFLPFFLLGYYLTENALNKIRSYSKIIGLFFIIIPIVSVYFLTTQNLIDSHVLTMSSYRDSFDLLVRGAVFINALMISVGMIILTPNKKIVGLTNWGVQSLIIFIIHRYFTFIFYLFIRPNDWQPYHLITAFVLSILLCGVLANKYIVKLYDFLFDFIKNLFYDPKRTAIALSKIALGATVVVIVVLSLFSYTKNRLEQSAIHPAVSREMMDKINNSIRISFVGDMILLEDDIKNSYKDGVYDFSSIFKYTTSHFEKSDLNIAVLEMPIANSTSYSQGNFNDGQELIFNAPFAFGEAMRDAGINLVTTANNHSLDKGVEGLLDTLDNLDRLGISSVGTYRNQEERDQVLIKEIDGVKIAFFAYTYGNNYSDENEQGFHQTYLNNRKHAFEEYNLFDRIVNRVRSTIFGLNKSWYLDKAAKAAVLQDIQRAQEVGADYIIAIPHWGTQFVHYADDFTRAWAEFMFDSGVDIILGSHSHATQPIEFSDNKFVVYSPGNFICSYLKDNGDATTIVNLYLSKTEKEIVASSIVPMWTRCIMGDNCVAVPIYDVVTGNVVVSKTEFERIEEVFEIVTSSMLGTRLSLDHSRPELFFLQDGGYHRTPERIFEEPPIVPSNRLILYDILSESKTVTVIGDSITLGSFNGGFGWFEPLTGVFQNTTFINKGVDSDTTVGVLNRMEDILATNADTYIIAIGTNDVRYRNKKTSAMTSREYIENIDVIIARIKISNPSAEVILVAPWLAFFGDLNTPLTRLERDSMIIEYSEALEEYAWRNNHLYIDANTPIRDYLDQRHIIFRNYVIDHIHPNGKRGMRLYANAFMFAYIEYFQF